MQANPNVAWLSSTGGHWGWPHTFKVQKFYLILIENFITLCRFHICSLSHKLEVFQKKKKKIQNHFFQLVLQLCGNSLWCRPLQQPRTRSSQSLAQFSWNLCSPHDGILDVDQISLILGWDYFQSLYYCFITLTTIGFGDFVALQQEHSLTRSPGYVVTRFLWL